MNSEWQINQEPVFIVGFPRSGTTYIQSLLCTQPGVMSFPETHFFNKAVGHYAHDYSLTIEEAKASIEVLQQKIEAPVEPDFFKNTDKEKSFDQKHLFETWLVKLAKLQNIDITNKRVKWIEKTPSHGMFLDKILKYYPQAKVIAMIRNPLKSIDSYYNKLIEYRKPFHDLAQEWKEMYETIESANLSFPNQVLMVKYESLAQNRDEEMIKVGDFIGQKIDLKLLSNYGKEASKLVMGNEPWKETNVNSTKFQSTVKHNIAMKNMLQIEFLLKPFFKKYNYPIEQRTLLSLYSKYRLRKK